MSRLILLVALALAACFSAISASAQTFPTRTVKFILPYGAASGTDLVARLVGDKLSARWGKPVVIENRPGGDGLVSLNAFVGANDDHTIWWGPVGVFAVHPYDKEKLPYDAARDLNPIVGATSLALSLAVPSAMNVNSLRQYQDLIRANPGKYNAAAASGLADFLMMGFLKSNGMDMAKVPYRDVVQAGVNSKKHGARVEVTTPFDAPGTPKLLWGLDYLHDKGYDLVEVFCSEGSCRNNTD